MMIRLVWASKTNVLLSEQLPFFANSLAKDARPICLDCGSLFGMFSQTPCEWQYTMLITHYSWSIACSKLFRYSIGLEKLLNALQASPLGLLYKKVREYSHEAIQYRIK
jgi:hypothetical protein